MYCDRLPQCNTSIVLSLPYERPFCCYVAVFHVNAQSSLLEIYVFNGSVDFHCHDSTIFLNKFIS